MGAQVNRKMEPRQPFLSVIVPAYNEAERIGDTLTSIIAYLQAQTYTSELIVVDDGSRDATAQIVQSKLKNSSMTNLIRYTPNRGKGYAVRRGVLASQGEYVLFTDADLSTRVTETEPALQYLQRGYDVVIGSRALVNSQMIVFQPAYRRLGAKIFNVLRDGIVGAGIRQFKDTQCGFKGFKGTVARQIFEQVTVDGFMFDVEVLYLALKLKYRVAEMPVRWADVPGSKLRLFRDTMRMFRDLAMIRLRHRGAGKG
ncbi:MAG: dolichyl-phosphate beta-glucosyltransferase [Chloroflexota bacterium]